MRRKTEMTAENFELLPEVQRRRIVDELERMSTKEMIARSRPLTKLEKTQELRMRRAAKARMARPVDGKGAKVVAVTLERGLLEEVDAFARGHGWKRSEMIARGLKMLMAS